MKTLLTNRAALPARLWTIAAVAVCAALSAAVALSGTGVAVTIAAGAAFCTIVAVRAFTQDKTVPASAEVDLPNAVRTRFHLWLPLRIAVGWMLGTFGLFWATGLSGRVDDPWRLTLFVGAATAAFVVGYSVFVTRQPAAVEIPANSWSTEKLGRKLVLASGVYFTLFGLDQLHQYGATGVGDIISRAQNPGAAYQAKFGVYEAYQLTGRASVTLQILTLAGVLYGVLGPLLVIFWQRLTLIPRIAGVTGLVTYAAYFLYIGTQKGLGDIVVMMLVGALAGSAGTWWNRGKDGRRPKVFRYAALVVAGMLIYMVVAQAGRADEFDVRGPVPPSPVVVDLVGDRTAIGVASVLFYPTHSYLGLSYNLGTPFQWTGGLGSSTAVASYATQYLGTPAPETYPARTEARTGWPAGMYWSTIYPWLASDLTWTGVIAFMFLFGWLFAKMWLQGGIRRDLLSLIIFGQMAIVVAYIPANNQLGTSRLTAIGFATLIVLYLGRKIHQASTAPKIRR